MEENGENTLIVKNSRVMYKHFFKRFLDFWISLIALIVISPILLVVTIWLHFANKGAGAFFFQERPGRDAKIFKVIKFKGIIFFINNI